MDINDLRGLATVLAMTAFIGICLWAYSSKRKAQFDDAAQLPFADDAKHAPKNGAEQEKQHHD